MKSLILDQWALQQKITRLAYEIVEDQFDEEEIYLVGIVQGGYQIAELLKKEILKIKKVNIRLSSLKIAKDEPLKEAPILSDDIASFNNKSVIIVDDVANSGRTIFYGFQEFLTIQAKSIKVAVLVDRKHKRFPVQCDYVGTSLNTTIKEHIEVVFKGKQVEAAYLV